jgi:hypothetical protein
MWFAILGGVAVGLAIVMITMVRDQQRYRLLFSDTHLTAFAAAIADARAAGPATTFEGIAVAWETMPAHVALVVASRRALAPAAARFLLAFARELTGKHELACLQLDKRRCAIVWPKGALPERAPTRPDDGALAALRAAAAEAMKTLPLTPGQLVAYRADVTR